MQATRRYLIPTNLIISVRSNSKYWIMNSFTLRDNGSSPLLSCNSLLNSLFAYSLLSFSTALSSSPPRVRSIFCSPTLRCFALTWIDMQSHFAGMRVAWHATQTAFLHFISCITIHLVFVYDINITSWNSLYASESSDDKILRQIKSYR